MKIFLTLLVIATCTLFSSAQKKNNLKAYMDYKAFYHPEIGTYVEMQLQFVAYTLKFENVDNYLQSEIAVQYSFKQNNEVVFSDAYRLKSPMMKDSIIEDFYDIKRIPLKAGDYDLELTLTDLKTNQSSISAQQIISIPKFNSGVEISSLVTAENIYKTEEEGVFTKSGYNIIPRISNYFSSEDLKIPVYLEIYLSKEEIEKNPQIGLKQSIKKDKEITEIETFTRFSKLETDAIIPIIRAIDISKLGTGEYQLEFSVVNSKNEELSKTSYYFERFSNDAYQEVNTENIVLDPNFQKSISDDSLDYYISSLIPISKPAEIKNIISLLKTKDKEMYRKYMQSYWTNTSGGMHVYEKWLNYKTQVLMCQNLFSTNFTDGHETDRGRVFLQYGPPSSVTTRENSPSEYPYEIWRYDKIVNFSNKRFIFYNPDLVNNTYRLLHSDMRGELQNYRWQQQLSKRNSANSDIDNPNDGNYQHFGGNSNTLYNEY